MSEFHATTICAVKRDGKTAIAGDGQVTMGNSVVMKNTAQKVRRLYNGKVISGFAGSVADAFTLFEKFEGKLNQYNGQLVRSAVELAKEWHPTANGTLTPQQVTIGSGKKVWWLCPRGHSYKASVMHRGHGTNCPDCNSGRQTSFAEQAVFYYIKQVYPDAISRCSDILPGRMELARRNPDFIIDGGHNPQCMEAIAQSLPQLCPGKKIHFLVGVMGDKDYPDMMDKLLPLAHSFVTLTPDSPRALSAEDLAAFLEGKGAKATPCTSVEEGLRTILAQSSPEDVICACGSLYMVGELRHLLGLC